MKLKVFKDDGKFTIAIVKGKGITLSLDGIPIIEKILDINRFKPIYRFWIIGKKGAEFIDIEFKEDQQIIIDDFINETNKNMFRKK